MSQWADPPLRMTTPDLEANNGLSIGPAVHLTRVLPPGLSLEPPSIATVQTMLSYANLPMDTIALAVCILDSLPTRFRSSWRMSYPRSRHHSSAIKRHTLPSGPIQPPGSDVVYPEVTILAALMIANKFVEDAQNSTQFFGNVWGRDMWSCEQINATERCIMEGLGYRIMPLYNAECIKQARHDMELTRRELLDETSDLAMEAKEYDLYTTEPMSSGLAVVGLGLQLTPADTPKSELSNPFGRNQALDQEVREAFGNPRGISTDYLHMP